MCLLVAVGLSLFHHDVANAFEWGNWKLKPWGSIQEAYDSNIGYASSNTMSDFITSLRVGLRGEYLEKNETAEFLASLKQEIFGRHSNFNNFAQYFTGSYTKEFSYFDRLKLDESFAHAEDPRSFAEQFGRVGGRYDYYDNEFNASWTHEFNTQWSTEVKFRNEYYYPNRADLSSSVQFKPGVEVDYAFNSRVSVLGYADSSTRLFEGGDHLLKNSVGVGSKYYWTPKFYLDGRVGADFLNPVVGNFMVKPRYTVSLNDQRDERTLYTLSYTKEYMDTPYTKFFFNQWQVKFELKKELTERTGAYGNVFTGEGTYDKEGTKNRLNGAGVGVIHSLTKKTSVRFDYQFSDNHSNVATGSYKKHMFLFEITIKF